MDIEAFPSMAEENLDRNLPKYKERPWLYAEDTAMIKAEAVMKTPLHSVPFLFEAI